MTGPSIMNKETIISTDFKDLTLYKRGKVRDVYDLGDKLLIVSTDRISCFDVVLPTPVPYKGMVLTQLSKFWFDFTSDIIGNHLITANTDGYPVSLHKYKDLLEGRSMLVKKTKPIAIECVVRGYLSGSAWKEYKDSGSICGHKLPAGLKESQILPEPIFTPSTKADVGHDMNIDEKKAAEITGREIFPRVKESSLKIYKKALEYADKRGIIIADTKFEFGLINGGVILIDEILTPDSSRFWPKDSYRVGEPQLSFDKQFVRDYLETLNWDKTPPGPELPEEIVNKTSEKYLEAYKRLAGKQL